MHISLPCTDNQSKHTIQAVISVLFIYLLHSRNCTDCADAFLCAESQTVRFNQVPNNQLLIVTCFYVRHKDLIRNKRFHKLLLIRKDIGFMLIIQIVINHAPYRSITRSGYLRNNLNGMLTIKHIVDSVAAAYFHWIDLVQIEIGCCFGNMRMRQYTLILLVRNQVPDWNLLKVNLWHIYTEIFHLLLLHCFAHLFNCNLQI